MIHSETAVGAELLTPEPYADGRGSSFELEYLQSRAIERMLTVTSHYKVLRGLHFQDWKIAPLEKTVLMAHGRIYEVVADLRDPAAIHVEGYELKTGDGIIIPPWCAHGYVVLSSDATVQYLFDGPRNVEAERSILWSSVPITWPFPDPILSTKDKLAPTFKEVRDLLR